MEKRVVLFFILSFLIVVGYPYLMKGLGLMPEVQPRKAVPKEMNESVEEIKIEERNPEMPEIVIMEKGVKNLEEEEIIIETDLYSVVLSNRGATIKEWVLKNYTKEGDSGQSGIGLYKGGEGGIAPLSIMTGDLRIDTALLEGIYRIKGESIKLSKEKPVGKVGFLFHDDENGIVIEKNIQFNNESYDIGVDIDIKGREGPYEVHLGSNFGIVEWAQQGFVGFIGPETKIGDEVIKNKPSKINGKVEHLGRVEWTAIQDKYFIAALIPEKSEGATVLKTHDEEVSVGIELSGRGRESFRVYAGPKEYDRLKKMGVGLEDSIDFGWFIYGSWSVVRGIAKPLFHFLRFLYRYTENYGLSIIILTIGIRSLFIPLMHKSYKAMKAMQVLQPELKKLQKKYKDNKERLNREMIELYKQHGANPLGGCLPMLLQMPVFVALFNVLYTTIELREAHFAFWVSDLSMKDPFYVLPIIMGVSMLVQQKMQPTTMDPRQAKIFLFMPAFFTVLFLNFPAGLVLYWLTNNVLTILQQYITKRYFEGPSNVTLPARK